MANKKEYKSILLNSFSYQIEDRLNSDKKLSENFFKYIGNYIDKNNEILYHNTPTYRLFFSDNDRQIVYDMCDIDPDSIKDSIKKIPTVKSSWKLINDPFNIIMILLIRYYILKKNNNGINNTLMYLTLSLYASLHYKMYRYPPNDNIMQYTINRISNKFFFKKYGNISKALFAIAEGSHQKYKNFLTSDDDSKIIQYFVNLRSRLNNQMRVFANEFYKDQKQGNYLNSTEKDTDDDIYDNDENISGIISNLTTKISLNFFSSSINERVSSNAASISKISKIILKNTLLDIKNNENEKVVTIIRGILQTYLSDSSNPINSIGSQKFIAYSINIYSKSNTKDKIILEMKDILDYFLTRYCNKYTETEREMTKSNYRKAVFVYFILFISSTVNGISLR